MYFTAMNNLEKIVEAVVEMQKGVPLKDLLTDKEIEEALVMLANILINIGIELPPFYED